MRVLEPAERQVLGVAARRHLEDDGPARDALLAGEEDPADSAATELQEQHVVAERLAERGKLGGSSRSRTSCGSVVGGAELRAARARPGSAASSSRRSPLIARPQDRARERGGDVAERPGGRVLRLPGGLVRQGRGDDPAAERDPIPAGAVGRLEFRFDRLQGPECVIEQRGAKPSTKSPAKTASRAGRPGRRYGSVPMTALRFGGGDGEARGRQVAGIRRRPTRFVTFVSAGRTASAARAVANAVGTGRSARRSVGSAAATMESRRRAAIEAPATRRRAGSNSRKPLLPTGSHSLSPIVRGATC